MLSRLTSSVASICANCKISPEVDELLFEGMVPGGQQTDSSWMPVWADSSMGVESLLAEFYRLPGGEVEREDVPEGLEGSGEDAGGSSGPTLEEVATWQSAVVTSRNEPTGSDQPSGRLQARCFAVEWRGSVLLDKEEFVRRLFGVIGGEACFVLGVEIRKFRADYMVVVRSESLFRWRDWRTKLMFGHGGEAEGEGLFMKVRVPLRSSAEGTKAFVQEMIGKCGTYEHMCRYKEEIIFREHDKGYARPGRKRRAVEIEGT